jgi:hypothetical protein
MIRKALSILMLTVSLNSLACTNDFQCGFGNKCVKPSGSYSMNGICVTPTDNYGNRDYSRSQSGYKPHEISGCKFNTDCNIGYSCVKRSGDIEGICVK